MCVKSHLLTYSLPKCGVDYALEDSALNHANNHRFNDFYNLHWHLIVHTWLHNLHAACYHAMLNKALRKEIQIYPLKPLDTFGTQNKIKVYRFTNNLQGLQKVMVKDFSWNIIPWNALLFEKTLNKL